MDKERSFLKQCLLSLGHEADEAVDFLKNQLRNRFEPHSPLEIIAYRGFGNLQRSTLRGRILAYRKPIDHDIESRWNNLQQSYRRFETDEVPNVLVEAKFGDALYEATSDEEGYFTFSFDTPSLDGATSFSLVLNLPERPSEYSTVQAQVYTPPPNAQFGVISDIDDTVLKTNATSLLQMMKLTLLESSRTRVAFSGVDEFYQALHRQLNPVFYVSSSPWNLYDFLIDFMKLNRVVDGPLLLRDFGIDESKFIAGEHMEHKLTQIRGVLQTYPELPFILIGDSGQDDPEIYATIAAEFPDQILACYIRDVSGAARDSEVERTIKSLSNQGVDMLLVPDTLAAAVHASANNWLPAESLTAIKQAIDANRGDVS